MSRIKTRTAAEYQRIRTRTEAETVVNELALTATNQARAIAAMDSKILAIKNEFAPVLELYTETIKLKTESLHIWAVAHPDEFPKNAKSIKFAAGTIGFRTGTPKIALLNRKWDWDAVLKKLIEFGDLFADCIRTKEEVDKEFILSEHAAGNTDAAELASFGVKVTQDESFYVEPDLTPIKPRQTVTDNTPKQ